VIFEEGLRIPAAVHTLAAFRRWAESDRFPDRGRIDYLDGDLEVDMSPEDLYTHGAVKTAVAATLHKIVAEGDLGHVFVDRARVTSPEAELSAEPDLVVVLWESLDTGRARHVPGRSAGRVAEIEGAPDLVVEIVSDGSVRKDTDRLPRLYAGADIPELWRIDARGADVRFEILTLDGDSYRSVPSGGEGWTASPALGLRFRLTRKPARHATWRYRLDHSPMGRS
jgi:Uma2 family endonuclease